MLSSMVQSFTDPEVYAGVIPSTQVQNSIVAAGQFEAKATLIELHDMRMQRFSDNLPRVSHTATKSGQVVVTSFRTAPGPSLAWGGLEMTPETILRHSDPIDAFHRSSGDAAWGSVSVPATVMANIGSAMAGHELARATQSGQCYALASGYAAVSENPCRDWSAGNICARTFGPCRGSKGYRAGFARGYGVLSCVVGKPQRTQRTTLPRRLDAQIPCILGGQPRQTNLYVGIDRSSRRIRAYHAQLLSRTPRHAAKPLLDAPPHELRAPGVAKSRSCSHVRDRCRNRVWFLGAWPVRSGLQVGIWRVAFHDPAPKLRPVPGQPGAGERCCSQPSPAERHRSAVRPGDHLCTGRSLASTALNGFQDASG